MRRELQFFLGYDEGRHTTFRLNLTFVAGLTDMMRTGGQRQQTYSSRLSLPEDSQQTGS